MRTDWIGAWCVLVLCKSIINVLLGVYFLLEYGVSLNSLYFVKNCIVYTNSQMSWHIAVMTVPFNNVSNFIVIIYARHVFIINVL